MLTVLQEKLAEAHGLAISASTVTAKLRTWVEEPQLLALLDELRAEADTTRVRCMQVESLAGEELAEEMLAHANSISNTGADLLGSWFKAGTDALRAWTFLAMGEAAEVAVWGAVLALAIPPGVDPELRELAEWAAPVQERHLAVAFEGVRLLVRQSDPLAPRWG